VLVFTGGIGEHAAGVRHAVTAELGFLGIVTDGARNAAAAGRCRISPDGEPVEVWVVPADEERIIARETRRAAGS
jgi:acetate kinase